MPHGVPRRAASSGMLSEKVLVTSNLTSLSIQTERRTQFVDVTSGVREIVAGQAGHLGPCSCRTTAGIVLQASGEGAAEVAADVESALERLVNEKLAVATYRRG
jgi:thiamine phosphate synthase YjbQ (UPF0047 family)